MPEIHSKKIKKSKSSSAWLNRQLKDPYVAKAQREGYRCRAVYKLIELNEKFHFLKDGQIIVDLGCAPGGWSQYISKAFSKTRIIGMDLLEVESIPNLEFYQGDFTSDEALDWLNDKIDGEKVDAVISDMAPNTSGHKQTDHLRQMVLLEYAFDFAIKTLKTGGTFVAKSFTGGTTNNLLSEIKKKFKEVHHIKPPASRKESVEMFIVASGFKD